MKRCIGLIVLAITISGCTPEAYQKQADLQVEQLLKDRQKKTLDYTPQVEAKVETPAQLTRKSYETLPVSPVPPPVPPPFEPVVYDLPPEPLGPRMLFPPGTVSPQQEEPLTADEAREPGIARLRLGPPKERVNVVVLDLFQAISYAIQNSRDYQSQMEDLYLSALDVTLERHLFTPRPFASIDTLYTGAAGNDVDYRSALTIANTVGVRQQLPWGGEITASALVDFVRALNDGATDGESAQLVLSGNIPLLRGAGMVNLEPLIQTERDLVYQVRTFETFRRSFVVQIASQYFRLLTAQQAIINRRFNYISSLQLTAQSIETFAAGRPGTSFLSVQRAQQQLYTNQNNIITAEDQYQSSLDDFKLLIGMPMDQALDVVAIELEVFPPNIEQDVVELALKYRLDLQTSSDRVEDARRSLAISRNRLLPDLQLTGRTSIANRPDTPARQIDGRELDYQLGLNLDLPVDRVAERNAYRRSLISLERAQRNWAQTRDSIVAQVRDSIRAIRSARATLEIQQRSMDLARRQLDYANELLILGRATDTRESVDAQNQLLTAQDRFEVAKANYQIQILSFLRDTGTLRINPGAGALGAAMNRSITAVDLPEVRSELPETAGPR